MSSTNKTTNYDLSQFIGSDKPAWLTDYNQDMTKIDTGIKSAADSATGANGKADANTASIGDISYLSTTNKNNLVAAVNEVDSTSRTAQNTANAASTTATQAKNEVDRIGAFLTLNNATNVIFTPSVGTMSSSQNSLSVRYNSTKSLGKIYGNIKISNIPSTANRLILTSSDTGLRPSENITFTGCTMLRYHANDGSFRTYATSYTLNTNGTISLDLSASNNSEIDVFFIATLLFITDFGDIESGE